VWAPHSSKNTKSGATCHSCGMGTRQLRNNKALIFKRFEQSFRVTKRPSQGASQRTGVPEIDDLVRQYGGCVFEDGLYRIHSQDDSRRWSVTANRIFPQIVGTAIVFGQDWQGNQFGWRNGSEPCVLLYQIAAGEVYEISDSLQAVHDEEFVDHADEALNAVRWREWCESGGEKPSDERSVGYTVPLFLGGADRLENLGLCNTEVYWDITAQMCAQVRRLPPGTPISGVQIVENN
jgi:hypothetical protein